MSLAGRLEEIELAEVLHFLALNNRTGKVTLSRRGALNPSLGRLSTMIGYHFSSVGRSLMSTQALGAAP